MDWNRVFDRFLGLFRATKERKFLMGAMEPITLLLFLICAFRRGVFFTGIDYSGHGILAWIALWLSCAWLSVGPAVVILWAIKLIPVKNTRWGYFVFGVLFLGLFVSGAARFASHPILGEMLVGAASAMGFYCSLRIEED